MRSPYRLVLEPEKTCDRRRGPRSSVTCEQTPGHRDMHMGRSTTGKWFVWESMTGQPENNVKARKGD